MPPTRDPSHTPRSGQPLSRHGPSYRQRKLAQPGGAPGCISMRHSSSSNQPINTAQRDARTRPTARPT
eukprot:2728885-Prymnesium_polylepis.1